MTMNTVVKYSSGPSSSFGPEVTSDIIEGYNCTDSRYFSRPIKYHFWSDGKEVPPEELLRIYPKFGNPS